MNEKMMNYYNPNFYSNYPYNNGNNQFNNPYAQMPTQPQPQQASMPVPPLNGKMVDSVDMVRVTEVPIGGYGIFPKADLSEIYIKTWNPNGTTNIATFKPFIAPEPEPAVPAASIDVTAILEKMEKLEEKIDAVLGQERVVTKPQTTSTKAKKEITANDY